MAAGKIYKSAVPAKTAKDREQDRKITKLARRIASNKPELKYYKTNFGVPGTMTSLHHGAALWLTLNSPITLGNNDGNRIGHQIRCRFLELRIQLGYVGGAQHKSSVRAMIYIDKNPRGQANEIFGSTSPYTDSVRDFQGDNQKNFKVLYDKTVDLSSQKYVQNIIVKKRLNFIMDASRGNTGTYTDIDSGLLYLLLFTNNNNSSSDAIMYQGHYNLAYTDA